MGRSVAKKSLSIELNEKAFRDRSSYFVMQKILSNINNFFFKSNINNLISDLKQKNSTNKTEIASKIFKDLFKLIIL